MDKKSKVAQILLSIKQQAEELLDSEGTSEMTAEEIVTLAAELTTSMPITAIEYGSPVASVDRSQVSFSIGEFDVLIYGDNDEEDI